MFYLLLENFEKRNNVIEGLSGLIGHINLDQKAAFLIKSKLDLKIAKALAEIK